LLARSMHQLCVDRQPPPFPGLPSPPSGKSHGNFFTCIADACPRPLTCRVGVEARCMRRT
jgi:hypothetical protein